MGKEVWGVVDRVWAHDFTAWKANAAATLRHNRQALRLPGSGLLTADQLANLASADALVAKLGVDPSQELSDDLMATLDDVIKCAPQTPGTLRIADDVWGTILDPFAQMGITGRREALATIEETPYAELGALALKSPAKRSLGANASRVGDAQLLAYVQDDQANYNQLPLAKRSIKALALAALSESPWVVWDKIPPSLRKDPEVAAMYPAPKQLPNDFDGTAGSAIALIRQDPELYAALPEALKETADVIDAYARSGKFAHAEVPARLRALWVAAVQPWALQDVAPNMSLDARIDCAVLSTIPFPIMGELQRLRQTDPAHYARLKQSLSDNSIRCVTRFASVAALETIIKDRATPDQRPVILWINGRADYNGAFETTGGDIASLQKDYRVVYVEASTEDEAKTEALRLVPAGGADILFLGGHGARDSLGLGAADDAGQLDMTDTAILKALGSRVKKGGLIMERSCSNGKGRQLRANLANAVRVAAPHATVVSSPIDGTLRVHVTRDRAGAFTGIEAHDDETLGYVQGEIPVLPLAPTDARLLVTP